MGETEVIREVRSASDSESESESVSRSTGTSASRSSSVSEGTNRSATDSVSGGTNRSVSRSKGRSWGQSWTPKGLFGIPKNEQDSRGRNFSTSTTEGTSRGWSHSDSAGTSHGTSESYGSTSSETYGTTEGTSRSRTTGASETIQKRALVTPDEIGHLFARIDDAEQAIYPGLALVVISGEWTIALRRVNYYEDLEFIGRFEAHPDHRLALCVKDMSFDGGVLAPFVHYFKREGKAGLVISDWLVNEGQIVSAGEPVARVDISGKPSAIIKAPRAGLVTALHGKDLKNGIPPGPLFSLRYYDDGRGESDPLEDLVDFCKGYGRVLEREVRRNATVAMIWFGCALLLVIAGVASGQYSGTLVCALFCTVMAVRWNRKRFSFAVELIKFRERSAQTIGFGQISLSISLLRFSLA